MIVRRKITWVLGIGILIFLVCFTINTITIRQMRKAEAFKVRLLELYEPEVSAVIEHYELTWHSFEAQKNVELLTEVASGPLLEERQDMYLSLNAQSLREAIIKANVTDLVILDYTLEQFKAIAYIERDFDEFSDQALPLGYVKNRPHCGEYVFEREEGTWKAVAFFLSGITKLYYETGTFCLNGQRKKLVKSLRSTI